MSHCEFQSYWKLFRPKISCFNKPRLNIWIKIAQTNFVKAHWAKFTNHSDIGKRIPKTNCLTYKISQRMWKSYFFVTMTMSMITVVPSFPAAMVMVSMVMAIERVSLHGCNRSSTSNLWHVWCQTDPFLLYHLEVVFFLGKISNITIQALFTFLEHSL